MAGRTQRFGLNFFGGRVAGSIGENAGKFTGDDRVLLDRILSALESHDHAHRPELPSPQGAPELTYDESGSLASGQTLFYRTTFVDANGLETAGGDEQAITLPGALGRPGVPQVEASAGGALPSGNYFYAVTGLRGSEESILSGVVSIQIFAGEQTVTVTLPPLGDASSFRVWRMGTTEAGWTKIGITSDVTFVDAGAVPADPCACDPGNTPPAFNAGAAKYSVVAQLSVQDQASLTARSDIRGWRLYRTTTSGAYSSQSLVHEVVERQDEANETSPLMVAWEDTGDALSTGTPPLNRTTLSLREYVLPSMDTVPLNATGYPNNYPIVVEGVLYVAYNGLWVQAGGSGGGGDGGGGVVFGTNTVRIGDDQPGDVAILDNSQNSVLIGSEQTLDIDGDANDSVAIGRGASLTGWVGTPPVLGDPTSEGAVAVGAAAAAGARSVAVGAQTFSTGESAVAIGAGAKAFGQGSVAIGSATVTLNTPTNYYNYDTYLEYAHTPTGGLRVPSAGTITAFILDSAGEILNWDYTHWDYDFSADNWTEESVLQVNCTFTPTADLPAGAQVRLYYHPGYQYAYPQSYLFANDSFVGIPVGDFAISGITGTPVTFQRNITAVNTNLARLVWLEGPVGIGSVAIGYASNVSRAGQAAALGPQTYVSHNQATAVGFQAVTNGENTVTLGNATSATVLPNTLKWKTTLFASNGSIQATGSIRERRTHRGNLRMVQENTSSIGGVSRERLVTHRETFYTPGTLVVGELGWRWYNDFQEDVVVRSVRHTLRTVGTPFASPWEVLQLHVNGVSQQELNINQNGWVESLSVLLTPGQYLSGVITSVASGTPGSDLTLQLGFAMAGLP